MPELYPEIKPYAAHRLPVDARHTLYVEECGSACGLPALFLHGGPGAGCQPLHRRFFDPGRYRVVLFDQRGAGQSTPHAELTDNTLQHLIADIEAIRERLGIERWVVFGGSWGSTLALAYAEAHPQRVLGLIVRGIFLCRPQDIRWFYQQGANRLFPEAWEQYLAPIPEAERGDLVAAYHQRLTGPDEVERMRCAKAWSTWEGTTLSLLPSASAIERWGDPHLALALARIECHYFTHHGFLEPDQLLRDAHRLAGIPGVIVHGRYDVICAADNAWALARAWPDARLEMIADAGHAVSEPGIAAALLRATDEFAARFA